MLFSRSLRVARGVGSIHLSRWSLRCFCAATDGATVSPNEEVQRAARERLTTAFDGVLKAQEEKEPTVATETWKVRSVNLYRAVAAIPEWMVAGAMEKKDGQSLANFYSFPLDKEGSGGRMLCAFTSDEAFNQFAEHFKLFEQAGVGHPGFFSAPGGVPMCNVMQAAVENFAPNPVTSIVDSKYLVSPEMWQAVRTEAAATVLEQTMFKFAREEGWDSTEALLEELKKEGADKVSLWVHKGSEEGTVEYIDSPALPGGRAFAMHTSPLLVHALSSAAVDAQEPSLAPIPIEGLLQESKAFVVNGMIPEKKKIISSLGLTSLAPSFVFIRTEEGRWEVSVINTPA